MSRYLIILVDYSGGGHYDIATTPKYVADTLEEAQGAVNLLNEVGNYTKNKDEDGEWFDTHYAVREVEVWGASA